MSEVVAERVSGGVRLRGSVAAPGQVDPATLAAVELAAPGDTRVRAEGGSVTVTRFLADPSTAAVHDAAAELGKTLAAAAEMVGVTVGASAAAEAAAPPEPRFTAPPELEAIIGRYRTVPSPQAGWAAPDPSRPPVSELRPGSFYDVLERRGEWARVRGEDGAECWTDGRPLSPPGTEGGSA